MNQDDKSRFMASIISFPVTQCWFWTRYRNPEGYGSFYHDKKVELAHRWSYKTFVGPLDQSLEIDHHLVKDNLCIGPSCVNPTHLEAKTTMQHVIDTPNSNANKTHCLRGHEFTSENTRRSSKGKRQCLTCRRFHDKEKWRKNHPGFIPRPEPVSPHIGIDYAKSHKKWRARATVNKKRILIGLFNTEEEAYQALLRYKSKMG